MTPQEQQMIDGLISRIRSTQVENKDTQAEQHIQQGLAGYPDALYVLTQTVLVQQYGLDQAQAQINELKQQTQTLQEQLEQANQHAKSSGSGSFLSHIFGSGNDNTPQAAQPPQQAAQAPSYQPVNNPGYSNYGGGYSPAPPPPPAYPAQGYPAPSGGGLFGRGGGGGGFLQGALQTAAGVAAGEAVFRGMEGLFGGFGGHGGGYGFGGGGGGETIINNVYEDDDRRDGRGDDRNFADNSDRGDDGNFYNPGDDASRNLDSGSNFADTTDDTSSFDNSNDFGDSSGFDSGSDDFGSDDNS